MKENYIPVPILLLTVSVTIDRSEFLLISVSISQEWDKFYYFPFISNANTFLINQFILLDDVLDIVGYVVINKIWFLPQLA